MKPTLHIKGPPPPVFILAWRNPFPKGSKDARDETRRVIQQALNPQKETTP